MTTTVTKESLAARIAELESGPRSLKEDYTLAAYKMLLATMEAEPVVQKEPVSFDEWSRKCALQVTLCHTDFREKAQYIWDSARETQQPVSEQMPGWIPVSERMPENKPGCYEYLVFETLNNRVNHDYWNVPDKGDDAFTPFWNYYGEHVTHWTPLPAGPAK